MPFIQSVTPQLLAARAPVSDIHRFYDLHAPPLTEVDRQSRTYAEVGSILQSFEKLTVVAVAEVTLLGYNSTNFKVITDAGIFLVKKLKSWRYREDINYGNNLSDLQNRLVNYGAPILAPCKPISSEGYTISLNGGQWLVSSWKEHTYFDASSSQIQTSARALAHVHAALREFTHRNIDSSIIKRVSDPKTNEHYNYFPRRENFERVWESIAKAPDGEAKQYLPILEGEISSICQALAEIAKIVRPEQWEHYSRQLVHGDLLRHNILQSDGKTYFVDFEKVLLASVVYDIGALYATCCLTALRRTPNSVHSILKTVTDNYNSEAETSFSGEEIYAFAQIFTLHLTMVLTRNVFLLNNYGAVSTLERFLSSPRELAECQPR